ncbi:uncharacterized protein LOC128952483 [Oppia nitens]|uniref:uncharacterized protein LOC128952483 n=1 Tax=Oppia nitens TaxID=1686743 RepID=UPI0023DB9060|nr:uncharacterized protein LOC128952483 [Oppia nitens]XP_054153862.1 uncharacterized protein LOC128952483 [Oppia nitens]
MKYTEYTIVLFVVVITFWISSANAAIDCRRFVFAPQCRGVSAKRSQHLPSKRQNYETYMSEMSDDLSMKRPTLGSQYNRQLESLFDTNRLRKRFTSLLRGQPHENSIHYNLLLNSLDKYMKFHDLEE